MSDITVSNPAQLAAQLGRMRAGNIGNYKWRARVVLNAMSNDNGETGGVDYSQLNVYAGPELCDVRNMTVYADAYLPFLGESPGIHARIIGSSHCIRTVGGLPYYSELTSCRPIQMAESFDPVTRHYEIDNSGFLPEPSDSFNRHVGPYEVTVAINTREHAGRIDHSAWDLSYTFEGDGPAAPTAVRVLNGAWQTIHAYPEFGVDVWTKTEFERRA